MVIDFHTHIYPDKIAEKAVGNIGEFYEIPMQGKGTVDDLLESSRKNNGVIDRYVVFSAAAVPGQVQNINTYIAGAAGENKEFTGFGTLHPDLPMPEDEINRMISLGLKGVKFHPDMQKFAIDDERMTKIYPLLAGRLPVIFHTGDYRYSWSHPARLAKVLKNFPNLVVIAAHFGGWSVYDLALEYLKDHFCYFDVSSSLPYLGKRRAVELIRIYGAERFLFGSDYPMWNPASCLENFLELNLSDDERELILHKNAAALLDGKN